VLEGSVTLVLESFSEVNEVNALRSSKLTAAFSSCEEALTPFDRNAGSRQSKVLLPLKSSPAIEVISEFNVTGSGAAAASEVL